MLFHFIMHHILPILSWSKNHLLVGVFVNEFIKPASKLYFCLKNTHYITQINSVHWSVTIHFPVSDTKRHLNLRIVYSLDLSIQIFIFFHMHSKKYEVILCYRWLYQIIIIHLELVEITQSFDHKALFIHYLCYI